MEKKAAQKGAEEKAGRKETAKTRYFVLSREVTKAEYDAYNAAAEKAAKK